jgi:hypothetical protein
VPIQWAMVLSPSTNLIRPGRYWNSHAVGAAESESRVSIGHRWAPDKTSFVVEMSAHKYITNQSDAIFSGSNTTPWVI